MEKKKEERMEGGIRVITGGIFFAIKNIWKNLQKLLKFQLVGKTHFSTKNPYAFVQKN
jgi:hypothetical protein